ETALARGRFRSALRLEEKLSKWEKPDGEKYLSHSEERRFRVLLKLSRIGQAREIIESKTWFKSAEAWHTSLWICLETAAWDLASELAQRALIHDEQDFTGLFARAEVLAETGQLEQAIAALNALRTMHPYEHNSYEKLAVHYAMSGQMEQAMEMAERAVLLGPFCPLAWATRGYIYFLSGQWEAARVDLELAWKRTNFSQRHESFAFWWILASLQNNPILALYRQSQAWREAHTGWRRAKVHQIRKHLNQTAMERLHYSLAAVWLSRLTKSSRNFFHIRPSKQNITSTSE
ncbi:MAG TPA: tetratricopeptide repeat protein, partial [Anaerolineales bacterium]|nr:tetratricopeptide repeat protein [Anaerolineales bacterium]